MATNEMSTHFIRMLSAIANSDFFRKHFIVKEPLSWKGDHWVQFPKQVDLITRTISFFIYIDITRCVYAPDKPYTFNSKAPNFIYFVGSI